MTDLDNRKSEFKISENGYDRVQVDAHVAHLQRLIADAEERVRNAEAEYVFDQHAAIGPRIAEIFALAEAEARELRDRLSTEGATLLAEAHSQARAIVGAAEQTARELRERVEHDQRALLAELEQDRARIHDEVAVLELRKGEALAELNRLSDLLGEVTAPAEPPTEVFDRAPAPVGNSEAPREAAEGPRDAAEAPRKAAEDPHEADEDPGEANDAPDETVELPAVKPRSTKRRRSPGRTSPDAGG